VGFNLACLGHRYRAVAGSNPALPTNDFFGRIPLWAFTFFLAIYPILRGPANLESGNSIQLLVGGVVAPRVASKSEAACLVLLVVDCRNGGGRLAYWLSSRPKHVEMPSGTTLVSCLWAKQWALWVPHESSKTRWATPFSILLPSGQSIHALRSR
jgi:hypothetical protein